MNYPNDPTPDYDKRVRRYERQGMTRSDAQGVVDAEIRRAQATTNENRDVTRAKRPTRAQNPGMIPRSLHAPRIIAAVARYDWSVTGLGGAMHERDAIMFVMAAAKIIGYPDARRDDPVIVAAVKLLEG